LNKLTYLLQICYRDGGRILPAYEPQNVSKWAWPGSRDPISKFWYSLYNWHNIKGELQVY